MAEKNGEAIYGIRPWRMYGEGPTKVADGQFSDNLKKDFTSEDFRFTLGNGCLYVLAMRCADNGVYRVTALGERDASRVANFHGILTDIDVLGGGTVAWERTEECLSLRTDVKSDLPIVFRVRMA